VDARAELAAGGDVRFARRADPEAGQAERRRRSLYDRERLADGEAELGVEASER
jgi:hypothetical protein